MFQIGEAIVATDVIEECFLCDLPACMGDCCVQGDSGAPLEEGEEEQLEKVLPLVWDNLSQDAQRVIRKQGVAYRDRDGDLVTSIVGRKNCVFTYYDEKGICKCAVEKAYMQGKTDFMKPVSCHLYPIRIDRYKDYVAVNYHTWSVCKAAVVLGRAKKLKIYQFLKAPLIRRFGTAWYDELCMVAEEYTKYKNRK